MNQHFNGNFGGDYVEGNKFSNRPNAPEPDHPNAIECPQCWKVTWRGTQNCVHCEYDVWLHHENEKRKRYKAILERRANICLVIGFVCLIVTICSFNYFSIPIIGLISFFGCIFSLFLSSSISKTITSLS